MVRNRAVVDVNRTGRVSQAGKTTRLATRLGRLVGRSRRSRKLSRKLAIAASESNGR